MKKEIAEFWRDFQEHKFHLARIETADDPIYDQVLASLQRVDPGLWFEFCSSPEENEFIVTAEGEVRLFPLVEEIVREAPEIPDWKIFALKPKRGFPVTTRWEQTQVTIGAVLLLPVFKTTGEMGLKLYAPDVTPSNKDDIHNALLRALDTALGEREFAESVGASWVYPIEEAPHHAIKLTELDDYLQRRKNKS